MEEIIIDIDEFINGEEMTDDEKNAICDLYNSICSKQIDTDNIVTIVVYLLKIMNSHKNIANADKKKLVIFVLKRFAVYNIDEEYKEKVMVSFIENILPNVIDTLIALDKNEMFIKGKQCVGGCCVIV